MKKGYFITFEGAEGSGKSTQIRKAVAFLKRKGRSVVMLREPGGTRISEAIRCILLDKKLKEMTHVTELLLYLAARAQIVREKIRRSAYQNYTHNETGEVYISFIISNDGYVKDVHLIEARTSASDYLKGIASRSVRDASPFPNFPKELDYPQLSFNIIISFEIE